MSRKRRKRKNKKSRALNLLIVLLILIIIALIGGVYAYNLYIEKDGLAKYLKIKLIGEKEITIKYKDSYKEKGAKASYKDLDISKKIEIDSKLDNNHVGEYKITYTIKYKKQKKSVFRIVNVIDDTKPEITLNGDNVITIYKDSKYEEPGAKATDDYDGDLTDKISITGLVDTKTIGEYKVTYKVKDSSDNESSIERTIKVIEKKVEPKPSNNNSNIPDGIIGKTSKGYTIEKKNGIYYINGILVANKSYPLPSNYNPGRLLDEFNIHFDEMKEAAKKDGVNLIIGSGFRSYNNQASIYNNYVNRDGKEKADTYSARPGHSEHQTGLAADIYGEASKDKYLWQSWGETNDGKWVNDNMYKYGFILRYVKGKENETGYMYESWHIRYVGKELAEKLYNNGNWITLEAYLGIDSKY